MAARGGDVYAVFGAYVVAKIAELADAPLYEMGHVASGHTLKHLAAAVGGAVVCRMLMRRTLEASRAAPSPAR